jgi:serine/threonine-protein phosphatase PP1 catalytic subunit
LLFTNFFTQLRATSNTEEDVIFLCDSAIRIFQHQPVLLELKSPITIISGTYGQLHETFRIFQSEQSKIGSSSFLFLGNYVDYGLNSIENLCLLLAYKIKFPDSFWMLRGQHETSNVNQFSGFYEDCKKAWPSNGTEQWERFNRVFNSLPIAAVIGQKIFCVHGGLSPSEYPSTTFEILNGLLKSLLKVFLTI